MMTSIMISRGALPVSRTPVQRLHDWVHGTPTGLLTLSSPSPTAVAGDLAKQPSTVVARQPLKQALPLLLHTESSGLPVLSDDGTTIVGWLTHRDVLHAYQARLHPSTNAPARVAASSP